MIDREPPPVPALVAELERLDRVLAAFGDGFRLVGNEYCGAFRWAIQHAATTIRVMDLSIEAAKRSQTVPSADRKSEEGTQNAV